MDDRGARPAGPRRRLMTGLVVVAMAAGAIMGYGAALLGWGPISDADDRLLALLQEQRQSLDASIAGQARAVEAVTAAQAQLRAERDRRDGDRLVEFATRQALERGVKEKDTELASVRAQLAFYEQLLPSGPPGTVAIRGFDLSASPDLLRYRVLLMRSGRPAGDAFKGRLQFVAEGTLDGETRTVNLDPLAVVVPSETAVPDTASPEASAPDRMTPGTPGREVPTAPDASAAPSKSGLEQRSTPERDGTEGRTVNELDDEGREPAVASTGDSASDTLAVEFVQYQRSQGLLAVPKGFQVRTVTLNVLEGATVRASRQVEPQH